MEIKKERKKERVCYDKFIKIEGEKEAVRKKERKRERKREKEPNEN